MMISKELFVEVIEKIKEQEEINNKVSDALELVCDGYVLFGVNDKVRPVLLKVLEEIFEDKNEWISWFLYEDVNHIVTEEIDGVKKEYDLNTPEALYDFLVREKELNKKKE